jgi:hypothetical protein
VREKVWVAIFCIGCWEVSYVVEGF